LDLPHDPRSAALDRLEFSGWAVRNAPVLVRWNEVSADEFLELVSGNKDPSEAVLSQPAEMPIRRMLVEPEQVAVASAI
jgi:hypothetical protein